VMLWLLEVARLLVGSITFAGYIVNTAYAACERLDNLA